MTVAKNLLNEKNLSVAKNVPVAMPFLDLQAALGITKHPGGYAATDELLALCQIEQAKEVLNVGCGIGVGAVYIAQRFGCHTVGVDLSEKMIAWSRQRRPSFYNTRSTTTAVPSSLCVSGRSRPSVSSTWKYRANLDLPATGKLRANASGDLRKVSRYADPSGY